MLSHHEHATPVRRWAVNRVFLVFEQERASNAFFISIRQASAWSTRPSALSSPLKIRGFNFIKSPMVASRLLLCPSTTVSSRRCLYAPRRNQSTGSSSGTESVSNESESDPTLSLITVRAALLGVSSWMSATCGAEHLPQEAARTCLPPRAVGAGLSGLAARAAPPLRTMGASLP